MPCDCRQSFCPECMGGYVPSEQPYEGAYRSALVQIERLTRERDEALGCDGNCACAVFASRHEAAMAGFKVQSERDRLRALLREVEPLIDPSHEYTELWRRVKAALEGRE